MAVRDVSNLNENKMDRSARFLSLFASREHTINPGRTFLRKISDIMVQHESGERFQGQYVLFQEDVRMILAEAYQVYLKSQRVIESAAVAPKKETKKEKTPVLIILTSWVRLVLWKPEF